MQCMFFSKNNYIENPFYMFVQESIFYNIFSLMVDEYLQEI